MEQEKSIEENAVPLLPYAAPELLIYNQSAVTQGGVTGPRLADFIGGTGTNYKLS